DHIFAPDGRLVVGEGERRAAVLDRQEHHVLRWQVGGVRLVLLRFGNVPVLAEEATHVAAGGSHRKNPCAREEVVERFLLHWIDLDRRRRGIAEAIKAPTLIDADKAETFLAIPDVAVARAKVAMNLVAWLGLPPAALMQSLGFLQNPQFLHR